MITIRAESAVDVPAVRRVNQLAFGQPDEAVLVDALRAVSLPLISLVAVKDEQVVGHILFSPVSIESEVSALAAMGLAPMAVLPERQRQGIGSLLVREGLSACRQAGYDVVVVLGHAEYYPRFGFVPAGQKGLRCEYAVPDDVFMVAELRPGALSGVQGLVKYHEMFGGV